MSEMIDRIAAELLVGEEFGHDMAARKRNPDWGLRIITEGAEDAHSGDCTKQPWTCTRCLADDYIARARILLGVMREPTQEMIDAVAEGWGPAHRWRAMIDAALTDRK